MPGLLVFPLVGLALAELVHGRRDAVAWVVRAAAYVYATFYTALDVISGIGAGWVTHELGPGEPRPPAVSLMFRIGTPLGEVGSGALIAVCSILVATSCGGTGRGCACCWCRARCSCTSATSSPRRASRAWPCWGSAPPGSP